eukprot:scaffold189_cov124-Skeletonema_dohrnii-CCMP3373.AAC.12
MATREHSFFSKKLSSRKQGCGGTDPGESCGLLGVGRPVGVAVGTYIHNSLQLRRSQVQYLAKVQAISKGTTAP